MKQITVVIPAYNAHDTIEQALYSIANQTAKSDIEVIVVNDKSKKGYDSIVKQFNKLMDIRVIDLEVNGGPGVARQKGLEACQTPYITFIDADDIYLDALFLEGVVDFLNKDLNCTNVNATFIEEMEDGKLQNHTNDQTWMFGKIYRVEFLRKNNIGFSHLRANEDLEFNLKIALKQSDTEYTYFLNDKVVYLWKFKKDSITRSNNRDYAYYTGILGYIEAHRRAYIEPNINIELVNQYKQTILPMFYNSYISILHERPDEKEKLKEVAKAMADLYHNYVKEEWDKLTVIDKAIIFNSRPLKNVEYIIPEINFNQFITVLEETKL